MAGTTRHPENPPESPESVPRAAESAKDDPVSAEELLELLGDEYTYRVFEAVVEQARTGREIMETAEVSKPTVYRRLERLEEAGLVESGIRVAQDGNHCKEFRAAATGMQVCFETDGFTATVAGDDHTGPSDRDTTGRAVSADD